MSVTFLVWNLENFFLGKDTGLDKSHKDPDKIERIAEVFRDLKPDVCFLCEVGGAHSLEVFNEDYLAADYDVLHLKGNSDRGIEVGYLIKKEFLKRFNLNAKILSHAKKPINFLYPHEVAANKSAITKGHKAPHRSHRMSRDLSELHLIHNEDKKIKAIFLGVHLKSRLDKEGKDWQGLRRRTAESNYVADFYRRLTQKYDGPLFICGDFNGELPKRDPEFRQFFHIDGLEDFTTHLKLPREECVSFIGMDRNKRPIPMQLDALLFHEKFLPFIEKEQSGFYRYRNPEGGVYPLAQNPGARHALPTDHYPLVTTWKEELFDEFTKVEDPEIL